MKGGLKSGNKRIRSEATGLDALKG